MEFIILSIYIIIIYNVKTLMPNITPQNKIYHTTKNEIIQKIGIKIF